MRLKRVHSSVEFSQCQGRLSETFSLCPVSLWPSFPSHWPDLNAKKTPTQLIVGLVWFPLRLLGQGKTGDHHLAESPRFLECDCRRRGVRRKRNNAEVEQPVSNLLVLLVLELANAERCSHRGSYGADWAGWVMLLRPGGRVPLCASHHPPTSLGSPCHILLEKCHTDFAYRNGVTHAFYGSNLI